ncbi:MAG: hypothetical protein FJ206_14270 [Gemmatimonadetes bacterium]|nr:hypothetical protein [Gemmatimonadota bacterium]
MPRLGPSWAKLGQARVVLGLAVLFVLALVVMAVLYGLTAPVAYRSVSDPIALAGLKKAIVRSLVQLVVYPAVLLILVWRALGLIKRGDG